MAILCKEINLLFICVPKTGSSSLENFLIRNFGGKQLLTEHIWDDDRKTVLVDYRHIRIKEIISHRLLTLAQLEQMKILAVTRNPFDWVVSHYVFIVNSYQRLKQEGEKAPDWIIARKHWLTEIASMSFDEYVAGFNNQDISVYSSFIEGIDEGKVEVVKLEQLDSEVKRIFQELGVELLQNIPHENKTAGKKTDFRLYYSNKSRQIIEQSFARDFDRLGYSFDDVAMFTVIKKIINFPNKFERKIFGYNIDSPNPEYSTNVTEVFLTGWVLPRAEEEAQIVVEGSGVMETFPCDVQRDDVTKTILGKIHPNIKCGFQIKWIHTGIFNIFFVIEGEKMLVAEIQIQSEIDSSDSSFEKKDNQVMKNQGYCYTCDQEVEFSSHQAWLRDSYKCNNCGSIPRERALMYCIEKFYPHWKQLSIHETSPASRGASLKLKNNCPNYQTSQYFPEFPLGETHSSGWRNEDLENQTFADETFDLVISQDVMEHIFNPEKAFSEIARTLKHGGAHIFTVPIVNKQKPSSVRATLEANGEINYLEEAQYHGNPVNPQGSLVTRDWGYDICDFILKHSGLYTTIVYIDDISLGIRAEYIEVLISRKI
ncbi:methyltransferase domain-containing protein [Planktothrix paucivesiculata]|uniref:Methyltransferase type 11 (Modular protein) n=1 Tax=Planktothrix paucivesiculata PCC 9631 TaxID=671071 RepID=A0A7Z9E3Y6_9CYAN|nr:methyltransferase domain-containing protein [Planktothrix paucivesiculata]VXD25591.1 Methyltransferase type 11 (modular protein) [Planktothrix paucivesiculata PCC 9631]